MKFFPYTNSYFSLKTGIEYSKDDMDLIDNEHILWDKTFVEKPEISLKERKHVYKSLSTASGEKLDSLSALRGQLVDNFSPEWAVEIIDEQIDEERKRYIKYKNLSKIKKDGSLEWEQKIAKAKQHPIQELLEIPPNIRTTGRITMIKCPFHNEKTPSFAVYNNNNTYYAWCCGEGGDVIDLYSKINKVSKGMAINQLSL